MNTKSLTTIFAAALIALGCSGDGPDKSQGNGSSFALGADISWTTKLEDMGCKFRSKDYKEKECTALMKEIGMNAIRLRVWVNPEDGYSGKEDVLEMARRAKRNGMKLMIDFHYSDSWADPGKQVIPAAWLDLNLNGLCKAVAEHTRDVLEALKAEGIDVAWVQVGNEVNDGMLYHKALNEGSGVYADWAGGCISNGGKENYIALNNAGYDAVKSVYPDAKVIVHISNGQTIGTAEWVLDALGSKGKYDIIGLSLYPGGSTETENSNWAPKVNACISNIGTLSAKYGRDVMICETGMDYWYEDVAYQMLSSLLTKAKAEKRCLGVFYWEPEADKDKVGYNMGAFKNSMPTRAMDAFTEAAGK